MSDFRRQLEEVSNWIADYRESIRSRKVLPNLKPGEIRSKIPRNPPQSGESFEKIMEDFNQILVPGMTHWNHPHFFAYFSGNNSEPSILAEALTATLGAQCMSWQTSPAATELEQAVMAWLAGMIGLSGEFTGVIQDTASTATLTALLMARERATNFQFREEGASAEKAGRLRVYASEEAHSSIEKGVLLSGIGRKNLVKLPTDDQFSLIPKTLQKAIWKDRAEGFIPCCVVGTIGTTSSTAVDPIETIGKVCQEEKVFFHVDAAFSGTAAILPEMRWIMKGTELADSFVFNPHKWLYTNFDCTAFYVKDVNLLINTCGITPEYLKTEHDKEVVNFRDWGIQLGRRFRALKLWFVIRSLGVEGLQQKIRGAIQNAALFRSFLEADPRFEVFSPSPFSLVCFRYVPRGVQEKELNDINEKLLNRLNETRELFLTHTKLRGKYVIRLNASQENTRREDIEFVWNKIRELTA